MESNEGSYVKLTNRNITKINKVILQKNIKISNIPR
jgi:hypothetical protein